MFGTLNTWLLWKLTDKGIYATDMVNACNTSLFNIHDNSWDKELIDLFELKESMLPEVLSCSEVYGYVHEKYFGAKIPICSMIDTPQGALFGAGCHQKGEGHISLGTGSFISINTGEQIVKVPGELTATVALARKDEPIKYSILGSVYSSGSVIDWLKMHLGIIKSAKEIEGLAYSVPDSGGVFFVPTLNGYSCIHTNDSIKGSLLGISTSTNIGHICRATLEGISLIISDIFGLIKSIDGQNILSIKTSGGMSEDVFLLQMVTNLIETKVLRSRNNELSAYGAAYLAGLAIGVWSDENEISSMWKSDRIFHPNMNTDDINLMKEGWKKSLDASKLFSNINIA